MYDLSGNSATNRAPGVTLADSTDVGTAIFPIGQINLPGTTTSLMLVPIESSGPKGAVVYPLNGPLKSAAGSLPVTYIEFGPGRETTRPILVDFATGCSREQMQLHRCDFRPARAETPSPGSYTHQTI
jgi:hypothetical protein